MKPVYDITMRTDQDVALIEVTARVKGMSREHAIELVKKLFPNYTVAYVIKMASVE